MSIKKASDLSQSAKSALEHLLGRPIDANEEVSISAVPLQQIARSASRVVLAEKLEAFLKRRAAKVSDMLDQELDDTVDQAIDDVRHSRT